MAVLETLGRQVGMHVRPRGRTRSTSTPSTPPRWSAKSGTARTGAGSGKPEAIIERMVEGRIKKYYEEPCCWSRSGCTTEKVGSRRCWQKAGAKLHDFARFQLGEGIEKKADDFAAEVAAASGVKPPEPPTGTTKAADPDPGPAKGC